jgi:hypothetical protein
MDSLVLKVKNQNFNLQCKDHLQAKLVLLIIYHL